MKKIILLILDGFGIYDEYKGNAVKLANTPVLDRLMSEYPCSELNASGEYVGLPKGQMGNSEVGHMTIGSGRITKQSLTLINDKIKNKDFFDNDVILNLIEHVNKNNSVLHLVGLISNGGVHSSTNHFYAALALAKLKGVKNVCFHFITDGRDTPPKSAKAFINNFMEKAASLNLGKISSIVGRYYAMDRDSKWERTAKAYNAMVYNMGNEFKNASNCLDAHYKSNITDEFVNASVITGGSKISHNDGVLFINFRPERMQQLIDAFTEPNFKMFNVAKLENVKFASIFKIHKNIEFAYQIEDIKNTFGEYLACLEYRQIRIAETEKYPHVTHFFDGDKDIIDKNYSKVLVPSPKVPTYDMKPEMSVGDVTSETLKAIDEDYDFVLVNFANPDMVGHTGNIKAAIDAIEMCDFCVGKIEEKAKENFYDLVITADHGNAEYMLDKNDNPVTSHTTNKVPFIICDSKYNIAPGGELADIVPTIIDIYEIKKPDEMTGHSLIIKDKE